jgi:DNA-binding response OmpR family regulator
VSVDSSPSSPPAAPLAGELPVVLYLEDAMLSQRLMERYLRGKVRLEIAPHLRAALDWLQQHPAPALLISDFMLPDGDALELLGAVRARYAPLVLPVLIVSGTLDRALVGRLLNAGANDTLAKPISAEIANATVARLLATPYQSSAEVATEIEVNVYLWREGERWRAFSPDTRLQAEGESEAAALAALRATLLAAPARSAELGRVSRDKLVQLRVPLAAT